MRAVNDQERLRQAWTLIEHQTQRSVDGVGLLPTRAHDTWSALAATASDFVSYRRLNDRIAESSNVLFGTTGLVDIDRLTDRQLRDIFRRAMNTEEV